MDEKATIMGRTMEKMCKIYKISSGHSVLPKFCSKFKAECTFFVIDLHIQQNVVWWNTANSNKMIITTILYCKWEITIMDVVEYKRQC